MATEGSAGEVRIEIAESLGAGPAFVNFPAVKPNRKVPFTIYSRDPAPTSSDIMKQRTLIAGETEDVEFFSTNRDRAVSGEGSDCQYLAAVYNPETNKLHVTSTPLYLLAHRVKRLRDLGPSGTAALDAQWKAQRNDLGEVFGTRKAKSQIKAEERNKVDVNAMSSVRADLVSSIAAKAAADESPAPPEVIPVPNLTTTKVSEVYPRESIVPDNEWSALNVAEILKAKDDKERVACLPFRHSRWIENKLRVVVEGPPTVRKQNLRYLFYLSCLLSFYNYAHSLQRTSNADLPSKYQGIPPQVLQGLLTRFAEPDGKKYKVTERSRQKLLMWICVCYLAADGWTVDVGRVAKDLKMPPTKVGEFYKSLGCSVELPSPAEREKLGLSLSQAQERRRAALKAPVKYPKTKRRGPAKH
ncbi:RNA polymerase I associated factor, A49-like protein [Cutaneotrichosporon oleaginosum]|uniref:RNA polymerase I associated factor, A49-like protein n=1 Tax=Cutaneotrichosporon oleaginosum TaxID=879819 RepID=A0A0J0XHA0_9TREE|nr:RNA polymerase I associated factor, A49-like protein [Cutaneotrichosporon oleaginosum]KLT40443.1 RNA polymerase I associated factor, A49-like protein [Cutaneotrichosporon oleaginosum]TXT15364.1 hypothetical protein COLE_01557 [Cutaneotrichosporon oleaginosum]